MNERPFEIPDWKPKINGKPIETEEVPADPYPDEPPVCHCGWVHYEGPCGYMGECDRPECLAKVEETKKMWAEFNQRMIDGEV